MAYIYKKADPGTGVLRWYGRVKVRGKLETFSLKLLAPGSSRLATERARRVQAELDLGALSAATREWMGEKVATRLEALLAAPTSSAVAGVDSWQGAMDGYLESKRAADAREPFPGKAVTAEEHARLGRMYTVRKFVAWTGAENAPFPPRDFADVLVRYLTHRLESVGPTTARTTDYAYTVGFGEWLASRGLCPAVDRKRVLEVIPPRRAPEVVLPPWRDDLAALRHFHSHRDDPVTGSTWRATKGRHAAWALVLLVRGLGCRPSEATSLSWETVDLAGDRVRFLDSKNGRHRTVPILWEWARDGLAELAGRNPTRGAVCLSAVDEPYPRVTTASNLMRRICLADSLPPYHLKVAQKLWIRQAIVAGFPRTSSPAGRTTRSPSRNGTTARRTPTCPRTASRTTASSER